MINTDKLLAYACGTIPNIPASIYHYTNEETVPLILTKKHISFRMTRIDDFDDVYEGKTIEIYYDLALEKLHKMNILTEEQLLLFSKVQLPEKHAFIHISSSYNGIKLETAVPYVVCFSKNANDPYMYKNYLKGTDRGCSLGFHLFTDKHVVVQGKPLLSLCNGARLFLTNVLYGEEIVDHLVDYIQGLLNCIDGVFINKELEEWILPFIEIELANLQYCSKLNKYRRENEVRMILLVSESESISPNPAYCFKTEEKDGRHFLYIPFHRSLLNSIHASDALKNDMDDLKSKLIENGYTNKFRGQSTPNEKGREPNLCP